MTTTVFVNGATLTDAAWFNDVNGVAYNVLGNGTTAPTTSAAAAAVLSTKTTVASATTPDIFAITIGQVVDYTGTATCTGFVAATQAGATRTLICAGAAVFTAGANMLIDGVGSGSNFTAAANDEITVIAVTTTQFRLRVQKYAGYAVIGANADITSLTALTSITGNPVVTGTFTSSTGLAVGGATPGAGGIAFPATQVAVADANTQDDYEEGTFTGTLTGCTTSPTYTLRYVKVGGMVTLCIDTAAGNATATSNATSKSITGAPATIAPSQLRYFAVDCTDNGGTAVAGSGWVDTSGVLNFRKDIPGNTFTAAGVCVILPRGITYPI